MELIERIKNKYRDFLLDHPTLKTILSYVFSILATSLTAFLLAYSNKSFVSKPTDENGFTLVAAGVYGLGQVIILFVQKIGIELTPELITSLQSIIYFVANIPLFLLAYFCIGKRFALLSIINVILASIFIKLIPDSWTNVFEIQNDLLSRAIFAGVCNGIGISIAVELSHSTGGTDIISMYFALKKGRAIGKYVLLINGSMVLLYTLLASWNPLSATIEPVHGAATMALYTLIFYFTSSVIIDHLSTRNKKVQLQIITSEPRLAKVLIQNFPHGCTVIDGKGAYLEKEKKVILTVISSFELNRASKIIYKVDPNAFISVSNAIKVYGKFFIKPIK